MSTFADFLGGDQAATAAPSGMKWTGGKLPKELLQQYEAQAAQGKPEVAAMLQSYYQANPSTPQTGTFADFLDMPAPMAASGGSGRGGQGGPTAAELQSYQPPMGPVAQAFQRALQLKQRARGETAAVLDVVGNIPSAVAGTVGYGAGRVFGLNPEEATAAAAPVSQALANPFGRLTGTVETPGYQGSLPTQAQQAIGGVIAKGAEAVGQRTGISPTDIEQGVSAAMMAAPFSAKPIKTGVAKIKAALPEYTVEVGAPKTPGTGGSVGAAAVDKPTAVNALAGEASPELSQILKNSNPNKVNLEAGQAALLEDKHGINLSRGQRTGQGYADEWNNRGAHQETIGPLFENQPAQVKTALEKVRDEVAPNIRDYGPNDIGQAEINGFLKNDAVRQENISNAYGDLKNKYNELRQEKGLAPTDQFPVDGLKFIENSKNKLSEELLSNDVPESLQKTLTQIEEANGQMTFDKFLKLNQRLGQYMKEGKGSERAAAFVIRQELQKIPLVGDAATLKPLADKAIALAKERFDTIRDVPGYKQSVKEAVSAKDAAEEIGSAGADTFHSKYVTKGSRADIQRMIRELGQDSEAHQSMKAGEIEALKKASSVSGDIFNLTPKGLHDYLYNQREKLLDLHGAEGAKNLNEINFLTNKIAQPKTKVFNYSNTLSGQIAEMAKQAGATGLEALAAKGTGGMSVPIVQMGKGWFANKQKEQFGRNAAAKYSGVIED